MARGEIFDSLEPSTDSRVKRTSGAPQQLHSTVFARRSQDGAAPAATTSLACCGASPLLSQGNPGQHGNDAARWLRKTKWSLEATDVSARSLAVVQLFDDLQQPSSTWEVSTRTKHEVERILRSDVSSRLVHPASVAPTNAIQEEVRPASPARGRAEFKDSLRTVMTQERRRTKNTLRQQTRCAAVAKGPRRHLPLCPEEVHDAVGGVPERGQKPNSIHTANLPATSEQMPDADPREKYEIRHSVQFQIGDNEAFQKFCETTFNDLQQLAMKTILKAWIKELEPKKQKRYPYCRTDKTGHPEWWPAPLVPHKEPDHLSKSERSKLAMTIIWYVMQPKFKSQGIDRLEDSTRSCKLEYESDKHWMPKRRQDDLKQLYAVARKRYMFENDEMDGTDFVSVSCLYKEPGRKRYRHQPTTKVNVELSTPQVEAPSREEHRQEGDGVTPEDTPTLNVHFPQLPTSTAATNGMTHPEEPLARKSICQAYVAGMASASNFLERNSFRQEFPSVSVLNAQHQYMHSVPGTQAYQYFQPPRTQWQPTAVPSGISPVTPSDLVNSSFDSSYDVADVAWPNSAPIMPLPLSSLQPNSAATHGLPVPAPTPVSLPHTAAEELFSLGRSINEMNFDATNPIHTMVEPYNRSAGENTSGNIKYDRHPSENSAENMTRLIHSSEELFQRSQNPQPWIHAQIPPIILGNHRTLFSGVEQH